MPVEVVLDVLAHPDLRRGDEPELDVAVLAQEVGEGAGGAPVGQVADDRHSHAVDPAELVLDRVEVEQRLRRMLAPAVAAVDHGYVADGGGPSGRSLVGMAEHDHVGVAAHDTDGVLERLALGGAGELAGVVRAHGAPSQAQHRGLEGKPGAGGGLVEKGGQDPALEPARRSMRLRTHLVSAAEDFFQEVPAELLGLDDVAELLSDGHQKTSLPASLDRT